MADLVLDDEAGVHTQFVLWGYAVTGDICQAAAIIAENKTVEAIVPLAWDRTRASLDRQNVAYGDEPYHSPPEWWALPCWTEHIIRGHAGYRR